jgi:hypothetical protein
MAERRMFAKTIIDSDAFLDMPPSTQALYFHLCMRADDEGFVNNLRTITRGVGCSESDIEELLENGYINVSVPLDGTYCIVHWNEHRGIGETKKKRLDYKYRSWRMRVLKRDGFICQVCGLKEKVMHAHHIKSFATYPEFRYELDNGITLCPACHLVTHGGRWR